MSPKWVEFGASLAELGAFPWYGITVEGLPHGVFVCLGEAEDGRVVCTGLLIDPRTNVEVTSRVMRAIPLGEIVYLASTRPFPRVPGATPYRIRKPRPGPKGLPLKDYQRIADLYRRALRTDPRTPVVRVMAQTGKSESTVHRYLEHCRALGLLDERITKGKQSP